MPDPPGTQWLRALTQPHSKHYADAIRELKLTPQERYAYEHHLRNLAMGGVPHEDGSLSSYLNKTFTFGDRAFVLPSVWDNKIIEDEKEIIRRAREVGVNKFPSYKSVDEAEARYQKMHDYMERDTTDKQQR